MHSNSCFTSKYFPRDLTGNGVVNHYFEEFFFPASFGSFIRNERKWENIFCVEDGENSAEVEFLLFQAASFKKTICSHFRMFYKHFLA